ncbi:MAG: F0F1 ATP synthase subunit epsilon [Firmicutes bacterium]|nr:F0F1 ATP synthase subunit epsilon [Bacillota bacterium]MCL5039922.1 F0F1 ATP synthase subunit epsilon [Bacillota bacterium]
MDEHIRLEVVTPEKVIFSEEVDSLVVPGAAGYLGVLPNHAPMIAALKVGVVKYHQAGQAKRLAVGGGFLEVALGSKATLLADSAERAESIDPLRAQAARDRALKRLRDKQSNWDHARAQLALQRALNRLRVAETVRKK